MEITGKIATVRKRIEQARRDGKRIGLVPTMGALHAGHTSLIDAAVQACDYVVVSIFVNPTQFGPNEDLDEYPRDIEVDSRLCAKGGVELIFVPDVDEMYPSPNMTWVNVEELTTGLCGRNRPGHFRGVTTVCNKLFNIVRPDIAFFGQKDAQQAIVIKRMVADTNLPLEIEICPTVREKDGLAMSSRNRYLDDQQRKDALLLYKALTRARQMVQQGARSSREIIAAMNEILQSAAGVAVEYVSVVDPETLSELDTITERAIIAVAARVKTTRLIDNIIVDLNKQ
ncbi:MAG: pantoate--beta-alanine ligase [Planctomycetes bacterium]|nr:pantoate--beta-alanine ligase [Planctomycetota bacterium]